jgi:hypothetical protein
MTAIKDTGWVIDLVEAERDTLIADRMRVIQEVVYKKY